MAQRNPTELIAGAAVLVVALGFLGYAVAHTGRTTISGYTLRAKFDRIDGLAVGADVRVAGVKVGTVSSAGVDPKTYQAVVTFSIENALKVPKDSSAEITSDGMLGGKFLALVPGGDEKMLADGGEVAITQSAVSLEQLLGKFIFSVNDLTTNVQKQLRTEPSK
ncbi:outer membrane lipid asymmetry maintenance protein MlaD [Limobrevibacterium gyesilva]|uniref:Outer membrane lipid asymmetry maintenance protein MlaD n=1 Tax=Limobrevibacterium gyesilva TaxID=2991712 RepID=A0AA41YKT0_9PROT|nr:outer membrane lipid asymmetry maintenance protein MlaD [Limobrevibacterium gyesilva]MCW3474435.1 outer membrane lipid asymmetry maintenance protein MlaD [Limobrevibacterium gyesilva]